jgi:hypothetical protein
MDDKTLIAILSCMIEDAGAEMMLTGHWPQSWLNDPVRRKILFDLNVGVPEKDVQK